MQQNITPWQRLMRTVVLDNKWLKFYKDRYKLPNGKELDDFYVVQEGPSAHVVPITADNKVLLTRQYRPAIDAVVYDFPAGFIEEDGRPPLEHAKRELVEETGHTSEEWHALGEAYPAPHRMDKKAYFFLALNVQSTHQQSLDETEFLRFEAIPLQKVKEMLQTGEFNCGPCMALFLRASLKLEALEKQVA